MLALNTLQGLSNAHNSAAELPEPLKISVLFLLLHAYIKTLQCIRRLCTCFFEAPPPERLELSILCLGLQGVGKTTLLAVAAGEPADNVEPTLGTANTPQANSYTCIV